MVRTRERGFTLLELLVVTSIIGLLASIALPRYASVRARGYDSIVQAAVRHVATGQEGYYTTNQTYTTNLGDLEGMVLEPDVTISVTAGNSGNIVNSFLVTATHPQAAHSYSWVSDPAPGESNFYAN